MAVAQDSLLYSRVETVLACEITDGVLKVGDQLPTEDSLIARFEVSRITARRAIQNLVNRGLAEIRAAKARVRRCTQNHAGSYRAERICGRYARTWPQADRSRDR
jgi:DNA-binding FadR family transcriptional regulator